MEADTPALGATAMHDLLPALAALHSHGVNFPHSTICSLATRLSSLAPHLTLLDTSTALSCIMQLLDVGGGHRAHSRPSSDGPSSGGVGPASAAEGSVLPVAALHDSLAAPDAAGVVPSYAVAMSRAMVEVVANTLAVMHKKSGGSWSTVSAPVCRVTPYRAPSTLAVS